MLTRRANAYRLFRGHVSRLYKQQASYTLFINYLLINAKLPANWRFVNASL